MLGLAAWVMEKVRGCPCLGCQFRRDELITSTSAYLGLDADDVTEAGKPWREQQRIQREMLWKAQQANQAQQNDHTRQGGRDAEQPQRTAKPPARIPIEPVNRPQQQDRPLQRVALAPSKLGSRDAADRRSDDSRPGRGSDIVHGVADVVGIGDRSLDLRLDDEEIVRLVPYLAGLNPLLGDRVVYLRDGSDCLVIEVQKCPPRWSPTRTRPSATASLSRMRSGR